jgi:F-type H+-transporting ATPase subunit epsilon
MAMRLTVVTAQRGVLERDDVTKLIVPAAEGQITILQNHAALMTSLAVGEMLVHTNEGPPISLAVHGGFLQVVRNEISVLADAAEHFEDIDLERAEAARQRAEARLTGREAPEGGLDVLRAQLALQRSLLRLRVARRRQATGQPSMRP